MTVSLSTFEAVAGAAGPVRVITPQRLVEAGILTDPGSPEGAYKRARVLVNRGEFKAARALLYPHAPGIGHIRRNK